MAPNENIVIKSTTIIFFFMMAFCLAAPERSSFTGDFILRSWGIQSGLKNQTVNSIAHSTSGYLWIGTPSGLVRFDGVRFSHYNRWNSPLMKNDHITCLLEDLYGNLWIGTDGGGLLWYSKGRWQQYSTSSGLSDNYIRCMVNDWQGNLWVGTDNGLSRYDQKQWNSIGTADGLPEDIITALETDREGRLCIGTFRNGVAVYDQSVVRLYGYRDGLTDLSVYSLKADPLGNLWIGTREGLFRLDHKNDGIRYISDCPPNPVTCMNIKSGGELFIATMSNGLFQKNIFQPEQPAVQFALSGEYIRCIEQTDHGLLWLGTDQSGLIQLKERISQTITADNGLPDNNLTCILRGSDGDIWAATISGGLCRIGKDNKIKVFTQNDGFPRCRIKALAEDNRGVIWAAAEGGRLFRIHRNVVTPYDFFSSAGLEIITLFTPSGKEGIWVSSNNGIFAFNANNFQRLQIQGMQDMPVFQTFYQNPHGNIFAAAGSELYYLEKDTFRNTLQCPSEIRCVYQDGCGQIWIGTRAHGLMFEKSGFLRSISLENGLPAQTILSVSEDSNGDLWLSSPSGIIKISRFVLDDFLIHQRKIILTSLFHETDGLPNSRCSSDGFPSASLSPSADTLLFATAGGAVCIGINGFTEKDTSPSVIIEEVEDINAVYYMPGLEQISSSSTKIRIRFTAFDDFAPENLYFRYQLAGLDTSFHVLFPGQERVAQYENLKTGEYQFNLQAAGRSSRWSESSYPLRIRIRQPFYTTAFFLISIGSVFAIVLTALFYLLRRRSRKRRSEKYKTVMISDSLTENALNKLNQLTEKEKVYLDPDLTLGALARKVHLHPAQLSRIINERFNKNFNDYINGFRVREAQRLLSDPHNRHKTILEIIYESGFYSKSVFNTVFKKITGQTPSAYRRKH